jgi:hypothetical protein
MTTAEHLRHIHTRHDFAAEETVPLLPTAGEVATTRIEHNGTLYSAMFFLPPLTKQKIGHYWTSSVVLGCILLIFNLILQVGLTILAGGAIVKEQHDFKVSLLGDTHYGSSPWTWVFYETLPEEEPVAHHVNRQATFDRDNPHSEEGKKERRYKDDKDATAAGGPCCNGASCAGLGLRCCDRWGARPEDPAQPLPSQVNDSVTGDTNFLLMGKPGRKKKKKKEEDSGGDSPQAVCISDHGMLYCNSFSFNFIDKWDLLDVDGNGQWTFEEAMADENNLGCYLGFSIQEIFRSTIRTVILEAEDTNEHMGRHYGHRAPQYDLPFPLVEHQAVPKDYFDWWTGTVVMCVNFDVLRCSQLIAKGIFGGAMRAGIDFTKGGVHDLDSALDYCQRLLEPGGICEKAMPGFILLHRSQVREKCGDPLLATGGSYANPLDNRDVMAVVTVGYKNAKSMMERLTLRYRFFVALILLIWYICVLDELMEIIKWTDFLYCFPVDQVNPLVSPQMRRFSRRARNSTYHALQHIIPRASRDSTNAGTLEEGNTQESPENSREASHASGTSLKAQATENPVGTGDGDLDDNFIVTAISRPHWCTIAMLCISRLALLVYLINVGTTFLLSNLEYIDLLFNAVALAMIIELPTFLYSVLYADKDQQELDGASTTDYPTCLPSRRRFASLLTSKFIWGCVLLPVLIYWAVMTNYQAFTVPMSEALQCTCFQEGPRCAAAEKNTQEWWDGYWNRTKHTFAQNYHLQRNVADSHAHLG